MTTRPVDADECERLVREQDPDRAVSVAFAPEAKRCDLLALYAFNIETARVREQVSQPLPGEIRLQWWRDRIAAVAASSDGTQGSGGHPVAEALAAAIRRADLPADAFDRFIEARIFDLYDDPMPDRGAFEAYAGETASALIMLAAMILDRGSAVQVSDAAGHAGVAQAAVGVLRLLPMHRARRQVYLPADLLRAAGADGEALLSGDKAASERAVAAMLAFAQEHWSAYLRARPGVPSSLRAAFLPADLTGHYLKTIERGGLAAIEAEVRVGPFRRSILYWRAMRG